MDPINVSIKIDDLVNKLDSFANTHLKNYMNLDLIPVNPIIESGVRRFEIRDNERPDAASGEIELIPQGSSTVVNLNENRDGAVNGGLTIPMRIPFRSAPDPSPDVIDFLHQLASLLEDFIHRDEQPALQEQPKPTGLQKENQTPVFLIGYPPHLELEANLGHPILEVIFHGNLTEGMAVIKQGYHRVTADDYASRIVVVPDEHRHRLHFCQVGIWEDGKPDVRGPVEGCYGTIEVIPRPGNAVTVRLYAHHFYEEDTRAWMMNRWEAIRVELERDGWTFSAIGILSPGAQPETRNQSQQKGRAGRRHYHDDVWAWGEVNIFERPVDKVYSEWVEREDVQSRNLVDPERHFKRVIKPDWA